MKYVILMLLLLSSITVLFAYTWSPWGPPGVPISKADWNIPAVLSSGHIGLNESNNWNFYTHSNLSVVDFTGFDSTKLIVLLGSGSNSDGVYFFNLHDHSFQLLRWTMNPKFVKYCTTDGKIYVGGLEGLWKTSDGTDWTEIMLPGTGAVTDFDFSGNHFVASRNGQTWFSPDLGSTWTHSQFNDWMHNFRFGSDNILYAIMNEGSYSDGLWQSSDYGETWSVIEWTLHLSCTCPYFGFNIPFGWLYGEGNNIGVGMTVPGGDYILLNDGLPNLNILCMDIFVFVNTPSFWVGTDQGAYFCTGFLTANEDQTANSSPGSLKNYPNPFSVSTIISINAPKELKDSRLEIYNIRGELVYSVNVRQRNNTVWSGQDKTGNHVANGVYLCRLVTDKRKLASKLIMLIK